MMVEIKRIEDLHGKRVHFIGIGGSGMSGIARIMIAKGVEVSGSDVKESSVTENLQHLGGQIFVGHRAENISGVDLLVISTAIPATNPERMAAEELGIPTIARAQALALLMADLRSVAIAGTHGKTTTTSMLTVALQSAGADPSFSIGGMINSSGINAYSGSGNIFVAEADESDGSFLYYKPFGAVITNIELDHVDHFKDLDSIYTIFKEFVESIQSHGFLILCGDDPGVQRLIPMIERKDISIITYGEGDFDWKISRIHLSEESSIARVTHKGKVLGELSLAVPGHHNLLNALAAIAAAHQLDIPDAATIRGVETFTGSRRRFEFKGEVGGIRILDDYGHHPTEIRVTLETARRYAGTGRVIVIFQPHRYTRTQVFFREFAQSLSLADLVYLLEIYPASEDPISGVSSLLISSAMNQAQVRYEPSMIEIVERVTADAHSGDVILTLGAGDVNSLAPLILRNLEQQAG
jgi:UDP-N-acetylmuramate--alanine ligase